MKVDLDLQKKMEMLDSLRKAADCLEHSISLNSCNAKKGSVRNYIEHQKHMVDYNTKAETTIVKIKKALIIYPIYLN